MIQYRIARAKNRLNRWRMAGHVCPERRPIGRLDVGEVTFEIDRAWFDQGYLVMTGVAGSAVTGNVEGHVRITGPDGIVAFRGQENRSLGVKTPFSTWQFTEALHVQGTQPPPAEPYRITYPALTKPEDIWQPWPDRLGRWLAARRAR